MTEWITGRQLCKRWEMTPDEIIRELGMHVIPLFERFSQDDLVSLVNGEEVPIALQKVPAKTYIFGKSLVAEAMRRRAKHDKDAELLRKANTYVWEHVRDCLFRLEDIEALERECPWLNPGAKARRKDQIDQALARARAEAWWKKDPSLGLKDMARKILKTHKDGRDPLFTRDYTLEVIEDWIRDLNPRYTKGRSGRKKTK